MDSVAMAVLISLIPMLGALIVDTLDNYDNTQHIWRPNLTPLMYSKNFARINESYRRSNSSILDEGADGNSTLDFEGDSSKAKKHVQKILLAVLITSVIFGVLVVVLVKFVRYFKGRKAVSIEKRNIVKVEMNSI